MPSIHGRFDFGVTLQAGTPLNMEAPTKVGNSDQGLMKKFKGFDGLAMSIGNDNADSAERGVENKLSRRFVDCFINVYLKEYILSSSQLFWELGWCGRSRGKFLLTE